MLSEARIEFRERRDFGQLMSASFQFIRQNFSKIFRNLLFLVGPFALVGSLVPGIIIYPMIKSAGGSDSFGIIGLFVLLFFAYVIGFIAAAVVVVGVTFNYLQMYQQMEPEEITTRDLWRATLQDFGRILVILIGAAFLSGCFSIGSFMITAIMTPVITAFAMMGESFVIVGTILTFSVQICVSVLISSIINTTMFISLKERINVFEAVGRAFSLIGKNWGQVFLLQLICVLVQYSMFALIIFPVILMGVGTSLLTEKTPPVVGVIAGIIIFGILLTLLIIFSACLSHIV
ncbi:MAG: hypothetical protein H7Y04_01910, partial [Verrucomicrobia bacterium]|nr:hypothetical protein [Cytophagales bacterium]